MSIYSFIMWNPKKEIFMIPYFNYPIVWYSLFFALGFIIGYYIFYFFFKRYILNFPRFDKRDIKNSDLLHLLLKKPQTENQKKIAKHLQRQDIILSKHKNTDVLEIVNGLNITLSSKHLFSLNPIKAVINGNRASLRLFIEKTFSKCFYTIREKVMYVADRMTLYVVVATIVGARLGHIIFYENIFFYLKNPLEIFKTWEGGLASHGAGIAIIIAILILSYRMRNFYPKVSFLALLDLMTLSTAFASICIRVGNFFNQEILGKKTESFYGVFFLNPADGSFPAVRHPVQLYEALFYAIIFLLLLYLSYKPRIYLKEGRMFGLLLSLVFTFRFFIEFIKERQSLLISNDSFLLMGQYLSIPFIILGIILFFIKRKKKGFPLNY